jgi:opacity protein-like surface antigen
VNPAHPKAPLWLALAALGLAAAPAGAGEPLGTDLFAGYSYAKLDDASRHGANVALGFHALGQLAAFVDLGAHWGSQEGTGRSDLTLMAGPGVRFGSRGGTVVFVRALAGLVRDESSIGVLDVEISESASAFGVLAGGGVDVPVSKHLALRAQGDYQWTDSDTLSKKSGFRLGAGVVCRFGTAP